MSLSRRNFMKAAMLAATASPLGWMQALAAPGEDYRALVCIFLYGGNDGNNMVIPTDADTYAAYAAARGSLALTTDTLAALGTASRQGGRAYALHPGLARLAPLYAQGQLAVVANVGPLVVPLSKDEYQKRSKQRPYSLFSHSDQTNQWLTSQSSTIAVTGWGGRMADAVLSNNAGVAVPAFLSLTGSSLFGVGRSSAPLVVPTSGTFGLTGRGTTGVAKVRMDALAQILNAERDNTLVAAAGEVLSNAITTSNLINPIMQATSTTIATAFTGLNNSIANQLKGAAKLIEARATTGVKRQIFFVSMGGYDTHSNQLALHQNLLGQLGPAMAAFQNALVALGVSESVTTFTASDFSRTLKPNANGTDHAWGNHQLVMGGAVKGGDVYGAFPTLVLKGPDDIDGSGRWVPTLSVDQYAATLASWFGVPSGELATVLPNLGAFSTPQIGFL